MTTLRHRTDALAALLLAAAAGSGCISHEETVRIHEERLPITFETDTAARTFYEAVEKLRTSASPSNSKTKFAIPVILSHTVTTKNGPHQVFNEGVRRADTDRDGTITEKEAQIFKTQILTESLR